MKKKLRSIFFAAMLTGCGVIAFQLYWLYSAYQLNKENFRKTTAALLQQSIDQYLQQQLNPGSHSATPVSFLSFPNDSAVARNKVAAMIPETTARQVTTARPANSPHDTAVPLTISAGETQTLQAMMAGLLMQAMHKTLQLDSLQKQYITLLAQNDIHLPVQLSFRDSTADAITAYIGLAQQERRVAAYFSNGGRYIFTQTLVPVLVSLLLMVLTAGCLWYMWRIIWQQKQLDELKNDFINNMTHELKTPIAILKTTHEALTDFGAIHNPEKALRYLQANTAELNKLESNVERILDITGYEQGSRKALPATVHLEALINDIIQRFTLSSQAVIHFQYNLPQATVETDAYALETIVANLMDNAIKYNNKEHRQVTVAINATPNGWQLSVEDNGQGIPAKQLPFIFDKFFRIPTGNIHDVKGYGLGLSYVKELTALLGATIAVQSRTGEGTIFTIQFTGAWKK